MRKFIFALLPLLVFSQNFVLKKGVLSAGGRKMTSTDYILQGTISQTAIGSVEDTDYKGVIGFWHPAEAIPPSAPYVDPVEKSGNDVVLTWQKITTDTLGNPESMYYYIVYRNTSPSFIPGPSDSAGVIMQPDTTFTDIGALNSGNSYYYLVKAVDIARNHSKKSNMGYKLAKSFNENAGATSDRNWTSLPWHSSYSTASDITADLSPSGDPLKEINNLRDDQLYENYTYISPIGWIGTNFSIDRGKGYEMITDRDTVLMLVGSNDPDSLVVLNENPGATSDRNWVSIPYNAIYNTVSDITTEYSPSGDPLVEVNNLRDDQLYENYTYISPIGWIGTNFSIDRGKGYEFVVVADATWNPTEYTNETDSPVITLPKARYDDVAVHLGDQTAPKRTPAWIAKKCLASSNLANKNLLDLRDVKTYIPQDLVSSKAKEHRVAGVSHLVVAHLDLEDFEHIVFTAYRPHSSFDVLTENIIGCGVAKKGDVGVLWFNTGNFKRPWQHDEEIVLIIEATRQGKGFFDVVHLKLDDGVDIQKLGEIALVPIPEPREDTKLISISWDRLDNKDVVGYSLYKDGRRINNEIIDKHSYHIADNIILKPVITGGYETVYNCYQDDQEEFTNLIPVAYSLSTNPNPFSTRAGINYALPHEAEVEIKVYDISGRMVKTLVSRKLDPGFYALLWHGDDNKGRKVAAGVYFIRMKTHNFETYQKIVVVH